MAITTSIGYDGTISEGQHARLMAEVGTSYYTVASADDFIVAPDPSVDRGISVGPGFAYGYGVLDFNDSKITKACAPVATGAQRYDIVVLRRNFQTNTSTIEILQGSESSPPGFVNADMSSPAPYSYVEQPLAIITVRSGSSTVGAIRDLRLQAHKVLMVPTSQSLPLAKRPGIVARMADTGREFTSARQSDGTVAWTDTSAFSSGRRYVASTTTSMSDQRFYGTGQAAGIYGSNLANISLLQSTGSPYVSPMDSGRGHQILRSAVYTVAFGAYSDGPGPGVSNVVLNGLPIMDLSALDQRQGGTGWATPAAGLLNQQASRTMWIDQGAILRLFAGMSSNQGVSIDYNFTLIIERIGG